MDLRDTAREAASRAELQAWLADALPLVPLNTTFGAPDAHAVVLAELL